MIKTPKSGRRSASLLKAVLCGSAMTCALAASALAQPPGGPGGPQGGPPGGPPGAPGGPPGGGGGGPPPPRPPSAGIVAARAEQAMEPEYKTSAEHFAALKKKYDTGKLVTWDKLPDWKGIWDSGFLDRFDGVTPNQRGSLAPLNAAAAAKYKAVLDNAAKGIGFDHLSLCVPAGFPRVYTLPYYTEFYLTPERTLHIAEEQSEVRRIYTDGRAHVGADEAYPLWTGDAIGFWNNGTLYAETTSLRAFDSGYQRFGPPQSEETKVVEEVKRVGDELVVKMTVYDPVNLTKPWRTVIALRKVTLPGARLDMWSCSENVSASVTADGDTKLILPGETGSGLGGTVK